jgi:hypothetical protein
MTLKKWQRGQFSEAALEIEFEKEVKAELLFSAESICFDIGIGDRQKTAATFLLTTNDSLAQENMNKASGHRRQSANVSFVIQRGRWFAVGPPMNRDRQGKSRYSTIVSFLVLARALCGSYFCNEG